MVIDNPRINHQNLQGNHLYFVNLPMPPFTRNKYPNLISSIILLRFLTTKKHQIKPGQEFSIDLNLSELSLVKHHAHCIHSLYILVLKLTVIYMNSCKIICFICVWINLFIYQWRKYCRCNILHFESGENYCITQDCDLVVTETS